MEFIKFLTDFVSRSVAWLLGHSWAGTAVPCLLIDFAPFVYPWLPGIWSNPRMTVRFSAGEMDELEVEWNSKSLNNFEEKELYSYRE